MKKLAVFLMVLGILAMSAPAFAQQSIFFCNGKVCTYASVGGECSQAQVQGPGDNCTPLDFGSPLDGAPTLRTGYSACFVLPVCACPNPSQFNAASQTGYGIGIRFIIQTTGVYFANAVETINGDPGAYLDMAAFKSFPVSTSVTVGNTYACLKDLTGLTQVVDLVAGIGDYALIPDAFVVRFFLSSDQCCAVAPGTPLAGGTSCTVPAAQRFKAASTCVTTPYDARTFGDFFAVPDAFTLNSLSRWQVEIPDIRIDLAEVTAAGLRGGDVTMQIQFLRGESDICADCTVICEFVGKVAEICDLPASETTCIYFPYVLFSDAAFVNGVALANLDGTPAADMEAVFTLTDQMGNVFTYTKSDFEASANGRVVWSDSLDNILPNFTGTGTPVGPRAWLQINTNFLVDGYSFLTDGNFGGSTLARPYCPGEAHVLTN